MKPIKKALSIYQHDGVCSLLMRGIGKAFTTLFDANNASWYEYVINNEPETIVPGIPVTIEFNSPEETIQWIKDKGEPWMYNQHEIDTGRLEKHYYPSVKMDGRIIGYAKVGRGKVYINDFKKNICLPSSYAFIYDTYVSPEYRGKRIAHYLIAAIIRVMHHDKMAKLGCHIPPWNSSSIALYLRAGFKEVTFIQFVKIFGIRMYTAKLPFYRNWNTMDELCSR